MAHNLYGNRIFYTGERPWHGIGTELKEPATAKEAIEAAKLDYNIGLEPIFLNSGKQIPGKRATVVADTNTPLGIVSDEYKIIQNVEAFDFFDSVVGEGKAIYHTAGALGKGERIWILAKLPKNSIIKKVDEVEKFLLLTNSHDGKSSLRMIFTPTRVVCQNTLNMALRDIDASQGISIRHIGNIKHKVEEAQRLLGIATLYYSDFEKTAEAMANKVLNQKEVTLYFSQVLGIDKKEDDDVSGRKRNQLNDLLGLFENGKGNNTLEIRHTLWAGYNAVAEYTDHYQTVRNLDRDRSLRLSSIWFGSAARMKEKAYQGAVSLLVK